MSTSYPAGLDSYTTLVDNVDTAVAAHINNPRDAIVALETKVGVTNSAVATTVDYFMNNASGNFRLHQHDGGSDDGALLDWDTCWTDAIHSHASAAEGGTLDWDTCWADAVHSHASAAEGGTLDWDTCWADAVHSHASAAEGGTLTLFGTIDTTTYNRNTNYQVSTDGFVFGYDSNAEYCNTDCYSDSTATPTRVVMAMGTGYSGGGNAAQINFCFPVKKNNYFRVETTGTTRLVDGSTNTAAGYKIFFMPLGN